MSIEDEYPLDRSESEADRLEIQGRLWVKTLGYALHPSIHLPAEHPVIADIATGTGGFLVDLASQVPESAELHGFDISPAQFRSGPELPSNVQLHVADAKEAFDRRWHGRFDAVQVRALFSVLDAEDYFIVVRNVMQLLKPGGAVQWVENDVRYDSVLRGGRPGASVEALRRLRKTADVEPILTRSKYGWCTIPDVFDTVGLVRIDRDVVSNDRLLEMRKLQGRNLIRGAQAIVKGFRGRGIDLLSGEDLEELVHKAEAEVEAGGYWRYNIHNAVGFKES